MKRCLWALVPLIGLCFVQRSASAPAPLPRKDKIVKTASGLKYQDLVVGKGSEARPGDTVEAHYTGWLAQGGKKIDSSVDRGIPFEFRLGRGLVIKGWDEGVVGMKVGGKRKLIIPAALGYGERGVGVIPPNADLVFDVELLKVGR